jgi:RAQPRD family integrative conjugative element protein
MHAMCNAGKRPMGITQAPAAAIIAASLMLNPAFADADAEREALARVVHELETLEPLIRTAESQANPDARVRFRYDWLRQDLARVRLGVREHIDAPRAEPRTFPPLRGDYRR